MPAVSPSPGARHSGTVAPMVEALVKPPQRQFAVVLAGLSIEALPRRYLKRHPTLSRAAAVITADADGLHIGNGAKTPPVPLQRRDAA